MYLSTMSKQYQQPVDILGAGCVREIAHVAGEPGSLYGSGGGNWIGNGLVGVFGEDAAGTYALFFAVEN